MRITLARSRITLTNLVHLSMRARSPRISPGARWTSMAILSVLLSPHQLGQRRSRLGPSKSVLYQFLILFQKVPRWSLIRQVAVSFTAGILKLIITRWSESPLMQSCGPTSEKRVFWRFHAIPPMSLTAMRAGRKAALAPKSKRWLRAQKVCL